MSKGLQLLLILLTLLFGGWANEAYAQCPAGQCQTGTYQCNCYQYQCNCYWYSCNCYWYICGCYWECYCWCEPVYCCDCWGCYICGWYCYCYCYQVCYWCYTCSSCLACSTCTACSTCPVCTSFNFNTDNNNCGGCGIVCSGGNSCCNGVCRNYSTDSANCGSCGNNCSNSFGSNGICCSGGCKNKATDNNNCGSCGNVCTGGRFCSNGSCVCPSGQSDCGGAGCRNLQNDASYCGSCSTSCVSQFGASAGMCCSGSCKNKQTDSNNCGSCGNVCTGGKFCSNGACVCPSGQTDCNGICKNLQTDASNCGTCGNACPASANTCCSGSCKNLQTDNNNCGSCGNVCTGGKFCSSGACVCPAGQTDCGGTCRNLQTDVNNCGACAKVCPAGNNCCSAVCSNPQTDNNNCGGCGKVCTGGKFCSSGTCVCPAGQTDCGGVCKNLQNDVNNCGACNNVCPAGNTCCSGACKNLQTDTSNCGTCGNVCTGGKTCQSGACKCPAGQTDCGGICKDLQNDLNNCGSCGNACTGGKTCQAGVCKCPSGQDFCGTPYQCNCTNYACNCTTYSCNCYNYACNCYSYACNCYWYQCNCYTVCACWYVPQTCCDCWGCWDCGYWTCSCWTECNWCQACSTCTSCSTCTACSTCTTCQTCQTCQTCYSYACRNVTNDNNNCGGCDVKCAAGTQCCGTSCKNLQTDNNNCGSCGNVCTGGKTCQSGACKCPAGLTDCSGTCKNLNTDNTACGSCTTNCVTNLGSGGICCSASCKSSLTDNSNCGGCGITCTGGKVCSGGGCVCPAGLTDCNGTCKNLLTDVTACGACSNACAAGSLCCSGACKNPQTDSSNCGGCGIVCSGGKTCQSGTCKCVAPAVDCGGVCRDLQTDNNNCGACSNVCPADRTCTAGVCKCNAGLSDCNGACRNLQTDKYNCGACDNFCPNIQVCVSGVCKCPTGMQECSGACIDILTDKNNCGACGNVCRDAKMVCSSGACLCTNSCTAPFVLNKFSCDCQCKTTCPGGQIVNAETCACESGTCKQRITSDRQQTFLADNFAQLDSVKIVGAYLQLSTDAIKLVGDNIKLNKDQDLSAVYVQDSGSTTQAVGYLYYDDLIKRGYIDTKSTPDSSDDALHDKNANGIADLHEDLFNLAPRTGTGARPYVGRTPRCSSTFTHGGKTYSTPELGMQGCTSLFYTAGAAYESSAAAAVACGTLGTTCLRDMRTSKWTSYINTSQVGADVAPPNWNATIYSDQGLFPNLPNLLEPPVDENLGKGLGNVLFILTDDDGNTATTNLFQTGTFTRLDGTTFSIGDVSGSVEGRPDYDASAFEASGEALDPADNPEPGLGEADRQRDMGTIPGGKELVFFQVGYGRSAHNASSTGTMSYPCLKYATDGHCTLHMASPINVSFSKPFLNLDMNARPEDPVMVRNAGCSSATTCTVTQGTQYVSSSRQGWLNGTTLTRLNTLPYGYQTLPRDAVVVKRHSPATGTPKIPHVAAYSPVTDPFRWFLGFEDLSRADSSRDYNDVVLIINKANGGLARSEVMTKDIASGYENEFSVTKVRFKRDDDRLRRDLGTGTWTETDANSCLGPPEAEITYSIALDCRVCNGNTGNCQFNDSPTWYDLEWTTGQTEQTLDMADLGLIGSQLCWKVTIDSPRDECVPRIYNVDVGYEALRAGQYSRSQLIPLANAVSYGTFEQAGPAWDGVISPKSSLRSYSNRRDIALRGHLFLNQLYDPADPKKTNNKTLWDAGDVLAKYVNGATNPDGRTIWTVNTAGARISMATEITSGTRAFPTSIYTARIGTNYIYDLNQSHSLRRRADQNDRSFFRDWFYGWEDRSGLAGSVFNDCLDAGTCATQTNARRAWPLGGVRLSTPALVTPPMTPPWLKRASSSEQSLFSSNFQSKLTTRDTVAYVGAMDGMLHAFASGQYRSGDDPCTGFVDYRGYFKGNTCATRNFGTGSELFAYAPGQLLPRYLRMYVPGARANTGTTITTAGTQLGYLPKQQATVDATASFADMDFGISGQPAWTIDTTGSRTQGAKTVLAMAAGPAINTVFALDVTDPASANYPLPLWEASLGFPPSGEFNSLTSWRTRSPAPSLWPTATGTRHSPTMVRATVGGTVGTKWLTIFPTDFSPATGGYAGAVYLFDTQTGALLADGGRIIGIVPLETNEGIGGEVVGADINGDGNYDVLYAASTSGKIFRINLNAVNTAAAPDRRFNVCVVADGPATLASKGLIASQAALQDVFSPPAINVLRDGTPRVRLFFGTGNNPDTAIDAQATNYYLFGYEDTTPLSTTCSAAKPLWQYKLDAGQNVWGGVSLNTDSVFAITATGGGADACNLGLDEGRFYSLKQSPDATGNAQANVGNGQTIGGQGVAGGVIYDEQLMYTTATGEVKLVGSGTFNNAPQGGNTGTRRTLRWEALPNGRMPK